MAKRFLMYVNSAELQQNRDIVTRWDEMFKDTGLVEKNDKISYIVVSSRPTELVVIADDS